MPEMIIYLKLFFYIELDLFTVVFVLDLFGKPVKMRIFIESHPRRVSRLYMHLHARSLYRPSYWHRDLWDLL